MMTQAAVERRFLMARQRSQPRAVRSGPVFFRGGFTARIRMGGRFEIGRPPDPSNPDWLMRLSDCVDPLLDALVEWVLRLLSTSAYK